jgi:hypothetical protein
MVLEAGLEFQAEEHVAEDVQPREERRFLKHHHALAARSRDRFSLGRNRPFVRAFEAGDHVEESRFAATALAHEHHELTLVHRKAHIVERVHLDGTIAKPL